MTIKNTPGIIVRTSFRAFHRWKDAPEEVSYLRDYHRHQFMVVCSLVVSHNQRDIEFHLLQKDIDKFLCSWEGKKLEYSCETMAEMITEYLFSISAALTNCRVEVWEDNEVGGFIEALRVENS